MPLSRRRWIVRYEGDVMPLAEQPTQADAVAEAREHARRFDEPLIRVHERDGGCRAVYVDRSDRPAGESGFDRMSQESRPARP